MENDAKDLKNGVLLQKYRGFFNKIKHDPYVYKSFEAAQQEFKMVIDINVDDVSSKFKQ